MDHDQIRESLCAKLSIAQARAILKKCFVSGDPDVSDKLLEHIPVELVFNVFRKIKKSDVKLAQDLNLYLINCCGELKTMTSLQWQEVFAFKNKLARLGVFRGDLTKAQLKGLALAFDALEKDKKVEKELLTWIFPKEGLLGDKEKENVNKNLKKLKTLADKPNRFPEAKRLYDLIEKAKTEFWNEYTSQAPKR